MSDHATHFDGCSCFRNRVLNEVLDGLHQASRQMKEDGVMVTIGGLIAAVEEMRK